VVSALYLDAFDLVGRHAGGVSRVHQLLPFLVDTRDFQHNARSMFGAQLHSLTAA